MKTSPTQRSLDYMRKRGYVAEVTEHWNAFAKIRKDLFGFIDILAVAGEAAVKIDPDAKRLVGVQTTSYENMGARITKIKGNHVFPMLKAAGVGIVVHGWRKKLNGWECKVVEL